jgi:organic hydroperoxide reductase OsmC/OhrA
MSYNVKVFWKKNLDEVFIDSQYSRSHTWQFDGGIEVPASSSPEVVPLPMSNEFAIDPEEAFVAALSSCHMLWFLSIAAKENIIVESYEDNAIGVLGKNGDGKLAMTKATLKPKVIFNNKTLPSGEQVDKLHRLAHEKCFIANSVKTKVVIMVIA